MEMTTLKRWGNDGRQSGTGVYIGRGTSGSNQVGMQLN